MGTSKISIAGANVSLIPLSSPNDVAGRNRLNARKINPQEVRNVELRAEQNGSAFSDLMGIKSHFNSAAIKVRNADRTMGTIETYIDEMKAQLLTLVKNYPPYPPGSEERVKILKSYNALWKQINQLLMPPTPDETTGVAKDPSSSSPDAPVRSIPELPADASDEAVSEAINDLGNAKQSVEERRKGAFSDTLSFIRSMQLPNRYGEDAQGRTMSEVEAEKKSIELKQALAFVSGKSLTSGRPELLSMAE